MKPVSQFEVVTDAAVGDYAGEVMEGIMEIHRRTTARYPASAVFHRFQSQCNRNDDWIFVVARDTGIALESQRCCAWVVGIRMYDSMAMPLVFMEAAWVRPGYHGEPLRAIAPFVLRWARARGCQRLLTATERTMAEDTEPGETPYGRWVSVFGCRPSVTVFERELA
jgi:GNAT superfamily N-acetyltransferase